jgi:hypothetical protein
MLTKKTIAFGVCLTAALALQSVVRAQATPVVDRFTFAVANADKSGPTAKDRMELVIYQWSNDADRDRIFAAFEEGPEKLTNAVWDSRMVGYMHWPGNLQYTIRYAYKTTRPDGEDIVLATERPISLFWDDKAKPELHGYNVIQLRLDKSGHGEGKLGTKLSPNKSTKTFVLDNYAAQPPLLTDVRRETPTASR